MRTAGLKHALVSATRLGLLSLGLVPALLSSPAAHAQTAPYLLPYTLSTYAGANAQYSTSSSPAIGAACTSGSSLFIQNASGDGCLALQTSINAEPHDVRVDGRGNVFYIDNTGTSSAVIHKINPYTTLSTLYIGNFLSFKPASTATSTTTKYGDGYSAVNDGVANTSAPYVVSATTTASALTLKAFRGLSTAPTGDLGIAGYNDYFDHDILATTNVMKLLAGKGASPGVNIDGPAGTSVVSQTRGIGFDPTGNMAYVADTTNNILRQIVVGGTTGLPCTTAPTLPCTTTLTEANSGGVKTVNNNVNALLYAQLNAPEDAQTDSYGNIYISDYGNNVIRAIYKGGTLPWFTAAAGGTPKADNIYTIAGLVNGTTGVAPVTGYFACTAQSNDTAPTYTYPSDGTTPTVSPLSVAMSVRKFSLDAMNNMYLADSAWNVIWFIDHVTGQMRLLAGRYYSAATAATACTAVTAPAGQPSLGCPANPNTSGSTTNVGDGCPGPNGQFEGNATTPDLAASADRLGNLFVTDAEVSNTTPAANVANMARIRKLLTGSVFPATATGSFVTQSLLMHFGPGDSPGTGGFVLTGNDYTVASTTCKVNTPGAVGGFTVGDNTDDCVVKVTFTPTHAGADTATLSVTSTLGATASFVLSGSGTAATLAYDPGNVALFNSTATAAKSVALDGAGNAYVADTTNNQVLFISTSGATTVFVPSSAGLKSPSAVALAVDGSVFVADTGNNLIRKVSPTGVVTTYGGVATGGASTGTCPAPSDSFNDNCLATQATFNAPAGLATDTLGNLYVADTGNNVIRVIASNGFVSAFAGGASAICSSNTDSYGDGCGAAATKFNAPTGLAFDPIGNYLYVADTGENRVRKIFLSTTYTSSTNSGTTKAANILINPVTAVAGNGVAGSTVDSSGVPTKSALNAPTGVAVDASGTVYIADSGNAAIRMVTPAVSTANSIISTLVGSLGTAGSGSTGSSATITASGYTTTCSTNLTTVTLTAINSFAAGLGVAFAGLTNATFLNGQNLSVLSTGLSGTQFQVNVPGVLACPPGSGTTYTSASGPDTGTASYSTSATSIQLTTPFAVALTPVGNLVIADAGNSRLLLDSRSQVSYNFGPVAVSSPATSSSPQPFTVTNIGSASTSVNAFSFTSSANTAFTLTGAGTSVGVPACTSSTSSNGTPYPSGSICNVNAVFTPTKAGQQSATFTDLNGSASATPSIALIGDGAGALTSTSAAVAQTYPATGDPQFSGTFTVQATITASSCNTFAPSCSPTGTVQFTVDNAASGAPVPVGALTSPANSSAISTNLTGLTVGTHSIACIFKADSNDNAYYAGSSCPTIMIMVDRGGTTSILSIAPGTNGQPQYPVLPQYPNTYPNCIYNVKTQQYTCTDTTFTATVSANTAGTPTGSATFYWAPAGTNNTTSLGTVQLSTVGQNAVATLSLNYVVDINGNIVSDGTLSPGNYTLSCSYSGDSNYATSTCAGQSFTVLPEPGAFLLNPKPCVPSQLYAAGTSTALEGLACPSNPTPAGTTPTVAIAQGSTTDVTLFVTPSNSVNGTVSFSCSGMPANAVCTFSPQTLTFSASTAYPTPQYTDVTLWTDIPPGVTPTKSELQLPGQTGDGTRFALILGWPLTLLGFIGLLRLRRAGRMRGLTLTALALLMLGIALTISGCGGPGIYHPNLTPTGTYAVTITATGPNSVSSSTTVNFTVTPGIAGQQ